ncbi:hypothetical protein FGSG_03234 [Fusarium graminearum PH-1]|uniref:hypothetical protein n=1 Tax=Gibberella zeae (strain ATCC MYA-4620 / CBS 123657 / FGSC 9075 / NRRL 31084 / PH-1) TaxID=229533 RepID=UPI00021F2067|nr:hypothetical protein FGSG_03234 [Fusarium graminearum PH-1]ESU10021.1 hypothetical protein FGSG_03234 [Fusarium graminearum PH-1]|eukprot:XP_011322520.1 hypothetical protein FGSG_03234 [Fusarium graminearum PH-1]
MSSVGTIASDDFDITPNHALIDSITVIGKAYLHRQLTMSFTGCVPTPRFTVSSITQQPQTSLLDSMAQDATTRDPSDDLDGDILTFSELDFARLGLVNKESNQQFSPDFSLSAQEYPFPTHNDVFAPEQNFFTDDFPLDLTSNTHSELWFDPELSLQSWQTTPPMQPDNGRDISPLNTTHGTIGTPPLASPSFDQAFAGLSPLESQHSSLPRRRSQYFRSQLQGTPSEPVSIPRSSLRRDSNRNPMQRWQNSPPEAEPASLSAIADALEKTPLRKRSSAGSLGSRRVASRAGSIASFGSVTSCSTASVGSPHSTARRGRVTKSKHHLVQHLRLVHHVKTLPIIDAWKVEGPPIKSRCGICDIRMETWQERVEHLAKHFRRGDTMEAWKGEHDFEPHVSARVTNALAPYIIAAEERAPVPFSATDPSSRDHFHQIVKNAGAEVEAAKQPDGELPVSPEISPLPEQPVAADISSMSFPEFLVHHLGRYAQQQMSLGIMPTDEMFQTEARKLVYNTMDPWDQTLADNKDWLSCFRNSYLGGSSSG